MESDVKTKTPTGATAPLAALSESSDTTTPTPIQQTSNCCLHGTVCTKYPDPPIVSVWSPIVKDYALGTWVRLPSDRLGTVTCRVWERRAPNNADTTSVTSTAPAASIAPAASTAPAAAVSESAPASSNKPVGMPGEDLTHWVLVKPSDASLVLAPARDDWARVRWGYASGRRYRVGDLVLYNFHVSMCTTAATTEAPDKDGEESACWRPVYRIPSDLWRISHPVREGTQGFWTSSSALLSHFYLRKPPSRSDLPTSYGPLTLRQLKQVDVWGTTLKERLRRIEIFNRYLAATHALDVEYGLAIVDRRNSDQNVVTSAHDKAHVNSPSVPVTGYY